jgi:hypothetical protein
MSWGLECEFEEANCRSQSVYEVAGECDMKNFIISVLILVAIALNCQALNPVNISQESGMAILANLNGYSSEPLAMQNNSTQNQTDQTGNFSKDAAGSLWSWGKIPIGYEVNKNESLIKLADQEWRPNI